MAKPVAYARSALKILRRMPSNEAARIRSMIAQYAAEPQSLGQTVKALQGSPYIRLRVGDWRIILDDRGNVLEIVRIGPRGGVYDEETGDADDQNSRRRDARGPAARRV